MEARYSDEELQEFKALVEEKIEKAKVDITHLSNQIKDMTEKTDDDSDMIDGASRGQELSMLITMLNRGKRHLQDLEYAGMRIKNKTYGVCSVSRELIDKKRLFAVPTTTKSLHAKTFLADQAKKAQAPKLKPIETTDRKESKILTKVIKKPNLVTKVSKPLDDDEEFDHLLEELEDDIPKELLDKTAFGEDDLAIEDSLEEEEQDTDI